MAEQDETKSRRRRRRSSEVNDHVTALLAKRDTLDADKAERDRIEKEALRKYAEAQVQLAGIDSETQRRVDELQQQIDELHQKARDDRAAGERVQAEVLATLNTDPVERTAEELSQLFELPIKRTRRMIRDGKSVQKSDSLDAPDASDQKSDDAKQKPVSNPVEEIEPSDHAASSTDIGTVQPTGSITDEAVST